MDFNLDLTQPRGDEAFDWRNMVVFDCEANGLLDLPDYRLHCGWTYDIATREYRGFRPHEVEEMADSLTGKQVVAHNGLGYDFKAMKKVFPGWECQKEIDTLVLTRMLWAADDLIGPDMKLFNAGRLPGNQIKRYGIEAWGYRMGEMKGDYSHEMKLKGLDPWAEFNEEMYTYNKQDVVVNFKLLLWCLKKLNWFQQDEDITLPDGSVIRGPNKRFRTSGRAVNTEMDMQMICLAQEERGLGFNRDKAIALSGDLLTQRDALDAKVSSAFKPWFATKGDLKKGTKAISTVRRRLKDLPAVELRRWSDKTGKELAPEFDHPWATTDAGNAFVPITFTTFNLRNRHHLANRLMEVYGWKPKAYGGAKGTDPVIDEQTIKDIPDTVLDPELKQAILDWYVIDKTYNTIAAGNQAYIKLYDENTQTIHGRCNPLGTITHRGSHDKPNLGNIASVELDEEKDADGKVISKTAITGIRGGFGHESRELFGPAAPFDMQTGTDVYALELFLLGHYLAPYDGGEFARRIMTVEDIHADNARIIGLPRKDTKTTTYKTLYGSGALDIGMDVWKHGVDDVQDWYDAPGVKFWITYHKKLEGTAYKQPSKQMLAYYGKGKYTQNKFLNGIPGLKELRKAIIDAATNRGYIIAIDGRKLSVRKLFAALNALLQGSGAVVCKMWIIEMRRMLIEQGLRPSLLEHGTGKIIEARDWNQIAWVHDETQNEHMKGIGNVIGTTSQIAIGSTSRALDLKVTLKADYKLGLNWAECH